MKLKKMLLSGELITIILCLVGVVIISTFFLNIYTAYLVTALSILGGVLIFRPRPQTPRTIPGVIPPPFHPNCRCNPQEYSLQQSQRDLRQMITRLNLEIDQLLVDIHANEGRVDKLLDANDLKRLELGRLKAHRDDLLSSLMIDASAMDKVIDHVVNAAEGEVK